jgi:hypothetical protein
VQHVPRTDSVAIDCFKCVSLNRSNVACEDPFHNNFSASLLVSPCWTGRRNRDGAFPATACIKLSGVYGEFDSFVSICAISSSHLGLLLCLIAEKTGIPMVVRDCALDSGTLTTDTELVRMSHCGAFYLDGEYLNGCVQSCFEDACNAHSRPSTSGLIAGLALFMLLHLLLVCFHRFT